MQEDSRFRRKDDEGIKQIVILSERITNFIASQKEKDKDIKEVLKELCGKQGKNPCANHDVRISYLEKIMWFVVSTTILLTARAVFNFFSP